MYESFYGLKEKPFSLLPDPAFLYLSKQHEMAITLLEYSLENQAGFCVITGKAGTGKTTLLRRLLNQIGDDISIGLITNTHHSFGELLRWILHAFSLDDSGTNRARQHQMFVDYLIGQYAKNRRTMLIIDEAQNMSGEALEELRMLSNINSEKDLLLQVILVGQPPLREILQRPELEQFAQRVTVDYHLDSLNGEETGNYIRHRLQVAGGERELFTDDACEAVFIHSGGIPRLINLLCDLALVYAYAGQAAVVTGELVEQVVSEREKHGALPIFAVSPESGVVERPLRKHAHSSVAAGTPETTVTRVTRHTPVRRIVGDAGHAPAAKNETAVSSTRSDISGNDRAHAVSNITTGEAQTPLVALQGSTVMQDAKTMPDSDVPIGGEVAQEVGHLPVTGGPGEMSVISAVPVAAATDTHNGVASSETSCETSNASVASYALQVLHGTPEHSNPADTHSAHRGRKSGRVAWSGRYISAMAVILLVLAAVLAWRFLDLSELTVASSGKASPVREVVTTQTSGQNRVDAAPASERPVATRPLPDASPIQQAVAETPVREKNVSEEEFFSRLKQIKRERDAALAIAEAAARERESMRVAAQARERALAAEHEAALVQERAKQLAQAAEKVLLQAHTAEMAAKAKVTEPALPPPMVKAEETPKTTLVDSSLSPQAGELDAAETGANEATTFNANPCKGPSARFLSTCE